MKKILPMKYPEITSYSIQSNVLSIIANYEETLPWYHSHFVQLCCDKQSLMIGFTDWAHNDTIFVPRQHVDNSLIKNKWESNICEFLINSINLDFYNYFYIDEYYIPDSNAYQSYKFVHNVFVYGYDIEEEIFFIAGSLKDGKYMFTRCTFTELENAYKSVSQIEDLLGGVTMYKYKKISVDFDLNFVANSIIEYLYSKNSFQYDKRLHIYKDEFIYGISVYQHLDDYLSRLLHGEDKKIDKRPFHALWDHKKCMLSRIKYMGTNNFLKNADSLFVKYQIIERETLYHRNAILKYSLTKNKDVLEKTRHRINRLVENEMTLLNCFLESINPL